ncbi:hypothetical protein CNE_1c25840 [Cupriavidus necator N-1]|uniref:Uncharacterized protein n=2 Tax=Cupriavidus necator TaxID=106590 RepID=G0ERT7_CUPNN|nr:hypothetical protein CNE_1c25840 [Cupriavidus necator N-1]
MDCRMAANCMAADLLAGWHHSPRAARPAAPMLWHAPCSIPVPHPPMAGVRGAGGQPVFGWIRPFVPSSALPLGTVIIFYEINYSFYADQMNNQFQNIDIRNNAPNANINVLGDQGARNDGRLI